MLDWHSCQICYPLEIKILLLLLLLSTTRSCQAGQLIVALFLGRLRSG